MAVTKQTYTATATWTAAQLADIFRTAFIDAGLMTDWYDSFLNTVENRILQVVYDAGKTYGTTYYWFMFTTSGVFVHTALAWNATTHVPTGTQYQNYYATTTNATTNHTSLISLAAATTTTLTRYTSGVNTDYSWFLVRNGTTNRAFMIPKGTYGPLSFVDLNNVAFNGLIRSGTSTSNSAVILDFLHSAGHTRRTYLGATSLRGNTTSSEYSTSPSTSRYGVLGNANATGNNYLGTVLALPTAATNTHSGLASDHMPVFTGPSTGNYIPAAPADFAVAPYFASNLMVVQDTLVVDSGTEEWEMVTVGLNSATDASKILFLARTV